MRLAFVTPRFGAERPTPGERLARELAERAPDAWAVSVFTTTAGGEHPEGVVRTETALIHRFAPEAAAGANGALSGRPPDDRFASPALAARLAESRADFDLVVLFGAGTRLAADAAAVLPERTVALPFLDGAPAGDDPAPRAVFEQAAACVFGSEAEEVALVDRFGLQRRMRETVSGALLLGQAVDPDGFRERAGLRKRYLAYPGPLQPGRGVEELLRYFAAFSTSHRNAALDLALFAPAGIRIPRSREIRVVVPDDAQDRLDAISGALLAVLPARLSSFASQALEPLSLGTPLLVNAAAGELVEVCRAANGGLYYADYEEFELILELALSDPDLFSRLGECGREYAVSRNDWAEVVAAYDRAFRSFSRPGRAAPKDGEPAPAPAPLAATERAPAEPVAEPPDDEEPVSAGEEPDEPEPEALGAGGLPGFFGRSMAPAEPPAPRPAASVEPAAAGAGPPDESAREDFQRPAALAEPAAESLDADEPDSDVGEPGESEPEARGAGGLPGFFGRSMAPAESPAPGPAEPAGPAAAEAGLPDESGREDSGEDSEQSAAPDEPGVESPHDDEPDSDGGEPDEPEPEPRGEAGLPGFFGRSMAPAEPPAPEPAGPAEPAAAEANPPDESGREDSGEAFERPAAAAEPGAESPHDDESDSAGGEPDEPEPEPRGEGELPSFFGRSMTPAEPPADEPAAAEASLPEESAREDFGEDSERPEPADEPVAAPRADESEAADDEREEPETEARDEGELPSFFGRSIRG